MRAVPVLAVMLAAGCATSYQSRGLGGGFSETQLDRNVWRVSFRGNAWTTDERASDFLLLRSAELALGGGFQYFVVIDSSDQSTVSSYTTPITSTTKANASAYGHSAYGQSETTTSGGDTFYSRMPGKVSTIVCFAERPNIQAFVFDAQLIQGSISAKYGIRSSPYGVSQADPYNRQPEAPPTPPAPVDAPTTMPAAYPVSGGCLKDVDCKGARICREGTCVDP